MQLRYARGLAVAYFIAYTLALTWPGAVPFNRIRPFVLGLPFVFFWVALWVAGALVVFWVLDRFEPAYDEPDAAAGAEHTVAHPATDETER